MGKSLIVKKLCKLLSHFSIFTSLSTAEAHVFGVDFIGLYGNAGLKTAAHYPNFCRRNADFFVGVKLG